MYAGTIISETANAGKFAKVDGPLLKMPAKTEAEPIYKYSAVPTLEEMNMAHAIEVYRHYEFKFTNNKTFQEWSFGYWIPEEERNPQIYIMEQLTKGYRKNVNRKD